jgi:hypothetical protein
MPAEYRSLAIMMPTREHVRKKRGGDNGETCPFFLLAEYWLEAMFLFLELLLIKIVLKEIERNQPFNFTLPEFFG